MTHKDQNTSNQSVDILVNYKKSKAPKLYLTKKDFYGSLRFKPLKTIESIFISTWHEAAPLLLKISRVDTKEWIVTINDEFCFFFFPDNGKNFLDPILEEFKKRGISVALG